MVQNFEEDILKIRPVYAKVLSKLQALDLLIKIKDKIYKVDRKFYINLFFGSKKFKRWSGYTIGYFIFKEFRKQNKNLSWKELVRLSPEIFLINF